MLLVIRPVPDSVRPFARNRGAYSEKSRLSTISTPYDVIVGFIATERPTIGLTCYWRSASLGSWTLDAAVVGQGYIEGVRLAGGRPFVLPPDPAWIKDPADVIDRIDGLLLTGGDDIDPSLWGGNPNGSSSVTNPRRDAVEAALIQYCLEQDKPILGICRGMQLLNVVLGGTLIQDIADVTDQQPHRLNDSTYGRHTVDTIPGSQLSSLCGSSLLVSSHHRQAIDELAPSLTIAAHAHDGLIEGVELRESSFCIGVLWHPDANHDATAASLFAGLVAAANTHSPRRARMVDS